MGQTVNADIPDSLPRGTLLLLARGIANKYGFPAVLRSAVEKLYNEHWPQPIILRTEDMTLWVDRYYIAYQSGDDVKYLYLTRQHIREELQSYRSASKLRNTHISLPGEINSQFRNVLRTMRLSGRKIWISDECDILIS